MITSAQVDRVLAALTNAGYKTLSMPLKVGSVAFEFAAVLLGPDRSPDLVLVVDTIDESDARIRQKISALSRALDVIGSRRPLTAILAGPRPQASTLEALGRVCRVLPVGTPVDAAADSALFDALSVLFPLHLPEPAYAVANPMGELVQQLPPDIDAGLRDAIISHTADGAEAVQESLRALLAASLSIELEGST